MWGNSSWYHRLSRDTCHRLSAYCRSRVQSAPSAPPRENFSRALGNESTDGGDVLNMSASIDFVSAVTAGSTAADVTGVEQELDAMYDEIERLDADISAAVERRTELARKAGLLQASANLPSDGREMATLRHFRELGSEGRTLGMLLLRMSRGRSAR